MKYPGVQYHWCLFHNNTSRKPTLQQIKIENFECHKWWLEHWHSNGDVSAQRRFRHSLSKVLLTCCTVYYKCMCIVLEFIGHLVFLLRVTMEDLIIHDCIFVGIPYTLTCPSKLLHVLCAKAKCIIHSIPFCNAPFWMCKSLHIILQCLHVSLYGIHPSAMHSPAVEKLLN